MKTVVIGGAVASLLGVGLGLGLHLPPQAASMSQEEAQAVAQEQAPRPADGAETVAYADTYPPSYVVDAAYQTPSAPDAGVPTAYDDRALDKLIAETDAADASDASPQDVAAAGDTTPSVGPAAVRDDSTSIDAILNRQQIQSGPPA